MDIVREVKYVELVKRDKRAKRQRMRGKKCTCGGRRGGMLGSYVMGVATGAGAAGALAIGSVAIGRGAIGKLAVRELRVRELTVERLTILSRNEHDHKPAGAAGSPDAV